MKAKIKNGTLHIKGQTREENKQLRSWNNCGSYGIIVEISLVKNKEVIKYFKERNSIDFLIKKAERIKKKWKKKWKKK